MSEKYSGTLSQETDFSKNKKQISVGITEVYFYTLSYGKQVSNVV